MLRSTEDRSEETEEKMTEPLGWVSSSRNRCGPDPLHRPSPSVGILAEPHPSTPSPAPTAGQSSCQSIVPHKPGQVEREPAPGSKFAQARNCEGANCEVDKNRRKSLAAKNSQLLDILPPNQALKRGQFVPVGPPSGRLRRRELVNLRASPRFPLQWRGHGRNRPANFSCPWRGL